MSGFYDLNVVVENDAAFGPVRQVGDEGSSIPETFVVVGPRF